MQLFVTIAMLLTAAGPTANPVPAPALKFDNVRLLVTRFDETLAFYRDVIGLKVTWGKEGENYASLLFPGGGQVALFRRGLMADVVGAAALSSTHGEQDHAALVLSADDVDAACAALEARGVTFVTKPRDQPAWGIRAAHFRDPEGNLLEIFSPLKTRD